MGYIHKIIHKMEWWYFQIKYLWNFIVKILIFNSLIDMGNGDFYLFLKIIVKISLNYWRTKNLKANLNNQFRKRSLRINKKDKRGNLNCQ